MKAITGLILVILMTVTLSAAQKASTTKTYDLKGPVKTVYETTMQFDRRGNGFMDMPVQEPSHYVMVFERAGELLFSESLDVQFHCGFVASHSTDSNQRVYDSSGNLVEYLPADTLEHSHYRLKHIYDSNNRLIETDEYDPYRLGCRWIITYDDDDEHGNWRSRTETPIAITPYYQKARKTEVYRRIIYY